MSVTRLRKCYELGRASILPCSKCHRETSMKFCIDCIEIERQYARAEMLQDEIKFLEKHVCYMSSFQGMVGVPQQNFDIKQRITKLKAMLMEKLK